MTNEIIKSKNYLQALEDIKKRVKSSQLKAHFAANREYNFGETRKVRMGKFCHG